MSNDASLFHTFLTHHDDDAWQEVLERLLPTVHAVDRVATPIWFAFYPLKLAAALRNSPDVENTVRELHLAGNYRLESQVDTSAEFLYGYRYWAEVKAAVGKFATSELPPASLSLADQITEVAREVGSQVKADTSLLVGIVAVAFMTLQQVGWAVFQKAAGSLKLSKKAASPDQLLRQRARSDGPGLRGFLNPEKREFTITFREGEADGTFRLINGQDLTTASAMDTRDFKSRDRRCIEGPVPMECRSASCGSCWIGVLSGNDRISEPGPLEIRKIQSFGYTGFVPDRSSPIRLACQTRCTGNLSIVIPPWNGLPAKIEER